MICYGVPVVSFIAFFSFCMGVDANATDGSLSTDVSFRFSSNVTITPNQDSINDVTTAFDNGTNGNATEVTTKSRNMQIGEIVRCYSKLQKEGKLNRLQIQCFCFKIDPCVKSPAPNYFDKLDKRRWEEHKHIYIIFFIIYAIGYIVGLTGNLFVIIAVFKYLRKDSVTNLFLAALAVSDFILVLICFPLKLFEKVYIKWIFGPAFCPILHYLRDFSFVCSTLTLTLISVERYIAICHPVKAQSVNTKSRSWALIATVWIISLAVAAPNGYIMVQGDRHESFDTGEFKCMLRREIGNMKTVDIFRIYHTCLYVVVFLVPISVMTFSYLRASYTLWRSIAKSKLLQGPGNNSWKATKTQDAKMTKDQDKRFMVIVMLICVLVIFFICWCPTLTMGLVVTWADIKTVDPNVFFYLETLAYMNSCINPILYIFLSRRFKLAFMAILKCSKHLKDPTVTYATATSRVSTSSVKYKSQTELSEFPAVSKNDVNVNM